MPTLTETEDRLRRTFHEVASSVHDVDETTRHAVRRDVPAATSPARSRIGGSRGRSPLLVFAASFLAVLAVGALGVLMRGTDPNGDLGGSAAPTSSIPDGELAADSVETGLGMDGTYFAIDDPSWTLMWAMTTPEGADTGSSYQRGDEAVMVLTGSTVSTALEQRSDLPTTTQRLNSSEVTERTLDWETSFIWTTSDGLPVMVIFSWMDREQAFEVGTMLRPVDGDAWQQLVSTAVITTTRESGSELEARTGGFGIGGEEGFGEFIQLDAPNAPELILGMAETIELPPGHTFDRLIDNLPKESAVMTEQGVMSMLEFEAGCIWTGYWLDAVDSGDTAAQSRAQAVLDEIPTWPVLNSTDGGGVIDAWTRNAELAAAGDVQGVLDNLYTNNCTDVIPGR